MATAGRASVRKQLWLQRRRDFDNVFRNGRIQANRLLLLRSVPNQLPQNRYGFVTSRRLGKAVVRNKVRRRLREAASALPTRSGFDVVITARSGAAEANFWQLKTATANLLSRAGILAGDSHATGKEGPS